MKSFQKINNITGWLVFATALIIYTVTLEPTVSFWDCGEFISSAYKMEIVHPPGSPLFAIVGRIFTLFAPSNPAWMINFLSGLSSAFCILFIFWSVTYLARKIMKKTGDQLNKAETIAVIGAGAIAGLTGTLLDSFWFSAVEGEVYALSAFFGFAMFWAMLKWDSIADNPNSDRWIILIGLLTGLGIGVHLLHLLSLPAMAFIFYFRRFKPTLKGSIITAGVGFGLLAFMMFGVLDIFVKIAARIDLLFVNNLGLPLLSGVLFYLAAVAAICIFLVYYSVRKRMRWLQVSVLSILMVLIGFSSYTMVFFRAKANTPVNMNRPADPNTLYSYLKREQYGSRPLFYGPYFMAEPTDQKVTGTKYIYDEDREEYREAGTKTKYIFGAGRALADEVRRRNPNVSQSQINQLRLRYDKLNQKTLFPRMGAWIEARHKRQYRSWMGMSEQDIPDFSTNMRFFFKYQINYMYMRYFLWNFSGRQDDIQGHIDRGLTNGNWITGIGFIDRYLVGVDMIQPESMTSQARNKYFMIPLILGLIGFFYHFRKDKQGAIIVLTLFFYTGIMNIINANQPPSEPRERDYAVAISFVAFAIWVGLGVLAIFDQLRKKTLTQYNSAIVASVIALSVPLILGFQGWDDHDRSGRYLARDSAIAYLESCAPNAILFTQGDNDTYPLWYIQEVENIRPDIRVVNLSLLAVDWYIDQLHNKVNDAPPIKLRFTKDDYLGDKMIRMNVEESANFIEKYGNELNTALAYVKSQMGKPEGDNNLSLPVKNYRISVDSARAFDSDAVPEKYRDNFVKTMNAKISRSSIIRDELIILDIIASNFPERPIYFSITVDRSKQMGLGRHMQLEGMAYRLVPVDIAPFNKKAEPFMNTDIMSENILTKWKWGGMDKRKLAVDKETSARNSRMLKQQLINCSQMLNAEGKKEESIEMLDLALEKFPQRNIPIISTQEYYLIINTYLNAGAKDQAKGISQDFMDLYRDDIRYRYQSGRLDRLKLSMNGSPDFIMQLSGRDPSQLSADTKEVIRDIQFMNTVMESFRQNGETDHIKYMKDQIIAFEQEMGFNMLNPTLREL